MSTAKSYNISGLYNEGSDRGEKEPLPLRCRSLSDTKSEMETASMSTGAVVEACGTFLVLDLTMTDSILNFKANLSSSSSLKSGGWSLALL